MNGTLKMEQWSRYSVPKTATFLFSTMLPNYVIISNYKQFETLLYNEPILLSLYHVQLCLFLVLTEWDRNRHIPIVFSPVSLSQHTLSPILPRRVFKGLLMRLCHKKSGKQQFTYVILKLNFHTALWSYSLTSKGNRVTFTKKAIKLPLQKKLH